MKENIMTATITCKPKCYHKNGWFKSVTFKWWIFNFKKNYFLCTDCEDLIHLEEFEEIRKLDKVWKDLENSGLDNKLTKW